MRDHQLIIYTTGKSSYTKLEPKVLRKWQYKNFSKEFLLRDLKFGLSKNGIYSNFKNELK